jgi:type II secretory pathway component PulJ
MPLLHHYTQTMYKKRRHLTLLEVMIALALAGILLSALTSLFYQVSKKKIELQQLKKNILPIELMRQRLIHLFARLPEAPSFYTLAHAEAVGSALFFTYDYGADPDPNFCGVVKGMLYLNGRKQLCLTTWSPLEAARQEVLLEGVGRLEFTFYDPKEEKWKNSQDKKSPLPPIFKLRLSLLEQANEPIQFAFFFPETDTQVTY